VHTGVVAPLSKKDTVPVGSRIEPAAVTVAVYVTGAPSDEGLGSD